MLSLSSEKESIAYGQKQPPEVFCKKSLLKKSCKIIRKKPMLESPFNKVVGLEVCNFIKKRLQHRCFPVSFTKICKNTFFQSTSGTSVHCSLVTRSSCINCSKTRGKAKGGEKKMIRQFIKINGPKYRNILIGICWNVLKFFFFYLFIFFCDNYAKLLTLKKTRITFYLLNCILKTET